jgi:hypothetical protein
MRWLLIAAPAFALGCDSTCPEPADRHETGQIEVAGIPSAQAFVVYEVAGRGSSGIGAISLAAGVGALEVEGKTLTAVAYADATDWPSKGDLLVQLLATDGAALDLAWLYCSGGQVTEVYYEGTDGVVLGDEPATGSCSRDSVSAPGVARLPPLDFAFPKLDAAFQIHGDDLDYDGVNPGTIHFQRDTETLLPFAHVDCSHCGGSGWQEMHALWWKQQSGQLGVGIFYFFPSAKDVSIGYPIDLPTWSSPVEVPLFRSTWKVCD